LPFFTIPLFVWFVVMVLVGTFLFVLIVVLVSCICRVAVDEKRGGE
jgi:hypothetical protein